MSVDTAVDFLPFRSATTGPRTGIRSRTLVLFRWIAITGQTTTVLLVHFVLGYQFPFAATLAVIGVSVVLNTYLTLSHPASRRLGEGEAVAYLIYDTLQLAVLLFLTGGLHNPYSFLMLTSVVVSATVLTQRTTILLIGLLFVCFSVLMFFHLPLPWPGQQDIAFQIYHPKLALPEGDHPFSHIYALGIWTALVVGMVFFAVNIMRVAEERRRMSDALTETQMALAREQQLSAVGGLAASAAHELGTPLATIAVVAKELGGEFQPDSPHAEDIDLLISQSERCRDILARLTASRDGGADLPVSRMPLMALVEQAVRAHRRETPEIIVRLDPAVAGGGAGNGARPEDELRPAGRQGLEIVHGLEKFVENAIDFARRRVEVGVGWTGQRVVVEIADDGPGFQRDVLDALGEPYVSTRRDAGGMGLGVFIAKTLLERTGAEIDFGNRAGGGAIVSVAWPRAAFTDAEGRSA